MTCGASGAPDAVLGYCWHMQIAFRLDDPTVQTRCTAATWREIVRRDLRPPTVVISENYTPDDRLRDLVLGRFHGAARDRTHRKAFRSLWWRWWGHRAALDAAHTARRAAANPDVEQLSARQQLRRRTRDRPPEDVVSDLCRVNASVSSKSSVIISVERRARFEPRVSAAR